MAAAIDQGVPCGSTERGAQQGPVWLFAYGSLIFKVDFPFIERRRASVMHWQRRFWQGSHDHRGTPEAPGRVVTLVRRQGERCDGVAYLVAPSVFAHLDHRERNGYVRAGEALHFDDDSSSPGVMYIADDQNPAFLGPAPEPEIARHIARCSGPSGPNRDYLLGLAQALREICADDAHVFALERLLQAELAMPPAAGSGPVRGQRQLAAEPF